VREFSNYERYETILTELQKEGLITSPLVAIEDFAFTGNNSTQLAELQGIVRFNRYLLDLPFVAVPIGSNKKLGTGKGNTPKKMCPMMIYQRYVNELLLFGKEIQNDNEADAIPLCHWGWLVYRKLAKLPVKTKLPKDLAATLDKLCSKEHYFKRASHHF